MMIVMQRQMAEIMLDLTILVSRSKFFKSQLELETMLERSMVPMVKKLRAEFQNLR